MKERMHERMNAAKKVKINERKRKKKEKMDGWKNEWITKKKLIEGWKSERKKERKSKLDKRWVERGEINKQMKKYATNKKTG